MTSETYRYEDHRYEARPTGYRDRLGLPEFAVIDRRYGSIEGIWSGYFAGSDARAEARKLNGVEGHD